MTQAGEPKSPPAIDEWEECVQPNLCRAPAYPYRRLIGNDIRLLNILPGDGSIECVLHQMPMVDDIMFYALSYVWGDGSGAKEILLDGQPFKVSRNLYEALQQLRSQPKTPVKIGYPDNYFWIDAICLNQADAEEKAHQVPRMMDIYRASLKVIIWLGPNKPATKSENTDKRAVDPAPDPARFLMRGSLASDSIVELLFERAESLWTDWELPDRVDEEDPVLRDVFGESYNAVLQAASELLLRPWFVRLWTVQECSLDVTSTVLAGCHGVGLENLIVLLKAFSRHHRLILLTAGATRIHALGLIEEQWRLKYSLEHRDQKLEMSIANCLLKILYLVKGEATDPRDQLYAVLGLVTFLVGKDLPVELRPNYQLPFEVIYWHYGVYLLRNSGDLRLLLCGRHELQDVPSWVPDFRYLSLGKQVDCMSTARISPDNKTLHLQGVSMEPICDSVGEWIDSKYLTVGTRSGLQYRIRYVEGRIFKLASQIRGVTLQGILDEFFWKVAVLFRQGGADGVRRCYTNLRGHSHRNGAWLPERQKAKTTEAFGKDLSISNEIRRSLVLLDDGTILSVSRAGIVIMPDDIVCLFKGATLPSIVRPSKGGDSLILVSQCHVMSGTFHLRQFDEDFWGDKELREFQLV
ncbi:heterokaryon incompatibility protein-domain-containing protein [Xylaria palmicola]|nr:heterokaryon incompatibility protein-domain-containing protein [Xylaria palmicola]